jgi:formylmethanofuran dehydrogenase subunit E
MEARVGTPRIEILERIKKGDLLSLLTKAAELHGHYCIGLSTGVLASYIALKKLELQQNVTEVESHVKPNLIAIVENNLCFTDGVQMIVGTTLGNNTLIFRDSGKQSVTVIDRDTRRAVRVTLIDNPHKYLSISNDPKFAKYFEKFASKREKFDENELREFRELMTRASLELLSIPTEKLFKVEEWKLGELKQVMSSPPIKHVRCEKCNELVLESKGKYINDKFYCLDCLDESVPTVVGRGIANLRLKDILDR